MLGATFVMPVHARDRSSFRSLPLRPHDRVHDHCKCVPPLNANHSCKHTVRVTLLTLTHNNVPPAYRSPMRRDTRVCT
jgi:hypothetical protein